MQASAFAAAAFAPLVVWVLWRIQAFSVDKGLRRGMYKLLRYQRKTYAVVSWMGVLIHELSHAGVLLVTGHGIRKFRVGVDGGHVVPRQVRRGPIGLLTFLAAAMAPMYVAPALLLGVTLLVLDAGLLDVSTAGLGWAAAWPVLRDMATDFPVRLLEVLVGLDLASWPGALVFGLIVFAMPSARPSYVAGKGGEKDEGDIAVVRSKVRRHPVTILVFFGLLYASYFALVPFFPAVYWGIWQTVWGVAMTAIVLAWLAGLGWLAVAHAGRVHWWAAWIPFAAAIAVQVLGRDPLEWPLWVVNLASLGAFVVLAIGLAQVAGRRW